MYNKFKDDGYYIESRKLRLENKLLKDKIIELESRLNLHLTPSPLVVSQDKPTSDTRNQVIFSRGSQINNRDSTVKPVEVRPVGMRPVEVRPVGMKPIINRCRAIRNSNDKQCKQCNNSNQSGGPILNGFCGYHSHYR